MTRWTDFLPEMTIPLALWTLGRVWRRLRAEMRAKSELEGVLLRMAESDPEMRKALAAVADPPIRKDRAGEILSRGMAALDSADAAVVRESLALAGRQGGSNYVRDIARHVNARLINS